MDSSKQLTGRLFTLIFLVLAAFSGFAQSSRPLVSEINAYPSASNKITISWSLPSKTQGSSISSLVIYRDTRPITDIEALARLIPVAKLPYGSVTYTDTVKDFLEYYYAVITITRPGDYESDNELYYDEELDAPVKQGDEIPFLMLIPGVNSTVDGVKVVKTEQETKIESKNTLTQKARNPDLRDQPLPYIDILGEQQGSESLISEESKENALSLIKTRPVSKKKSILEPYVFEEDLISPSGGDEYLLFEVLRTTFIQKKYNESIKALLRFLGINRNPQVTARAKFYLGESYYYTGRFPDAMMEFMDLEELYPSLSKKWIESSLDLFEEQ